MQKCEDFMDLAFKASGSSVMDALGGLDATMGVIIGGCMEIYRDAKKLSVEMAEVFDQTNKEIKELKAENDVLAEQNKELRSLLNTTIRNQEKILEKLSKRD